MAIFASSVVARNKYRHFCLLKHYKLPCFRGKDHLQLVSDINASLVILQDLEI